MFLSSSSPLYLPRIFVILAVLALVPLLFPYSVPVFMALCFAVLTMPLFEKLNAKFSPFISIVLYTLALVFTIIIPISLAFILLIPQVINGISLLQHWRETGWQISPELEANIHELYTWVTQVPQIANWLTELEADLSALINSIVPRLLSGSLNFAGSVMGFGWSLFLFVVLTLIFLAYALPVKNIADKILNLPENMFDRFILAIRNALSSVVLGILLVALLQGLVCMLGFFIFQVPEPLFWGLLACLVAPIPVVGTFFVWGPLAVYLWFGVAPSMSIGLILWGLLAVAAVDNFTRPYFLSTGIKAPFFVLFLSLLCGLGVFGALGLILGPVLLAFALQCATEASHLLGVEVPKIREENTKPKKNYLKNKIKLK